MTSTDKPARLPVLPIDIRALDGWVVMTVQDQLVAASIRLPAAAADQLAASIGGALTKAAVEARRQASGLVVAGAGDMPK